MRCAASGEQSNGGDGGGWMRESGDKIGLGFLAADAFGVWLDQIELSQPGRGLVRPTRTKSGPQRHPWSFYKVSLSLTQEILILIDAVSTSK